MRERLAYLHFPKSAGTSIRAALSSFFDESAVAPWHFDRILLGDHPAADDIAQPILTGPGSELAAYRYAEEAVARVAARSTLDPVHATVWASLALLLCEEERYEEADAIRRRWIELGYTENPPIFLPCEAWIHARCGRPEEARAVLARIQPVSPIRQGFFLRLSAHAWIALGELERARACLADLEALGGSRLHYEQEWREELRAAIAAAGQ